MLGLLGMRNSAMMTEFYKILPLFFLTLALPVLADKIEETTDSEVYCITHAKRLILENDQTQLSESFFRKQSDGMVLHRIYETSRNRFQA